MSEYFSNRDVPFLPSASRTVTLSSQMFLNQNMGALTVVLDVTTAGTGNITLKIEGIDGISGKVYTILAGAAVSTVSTNVYKIGIGLTPAANSVVNDIVPHKIQVTVTHNNPNPIVYSVGGSLVCG